jgi:hypothetical protein
LEMHRIPVAPTTGQFLVVNNVVAAATARYKRRSNNRPRSAA